MFNQKKFEQLYNKWWELKEFQFKEDWFEYQKQLIGKIVFLNPCISSSENRKDTSR